MKKLLSIIILIYCAKPLYSQVVNEYMDLQIHTTMHIPYGFFGKGLTFFSKEREPKLSYKHTFKNVNYANYLEQNKGCRILVNGAIATEYVATKKKAKRLILKQIEYVNQFAKEHSKDFAVAKTPEEVRYLVHNTNKTIFIHSIEGGKKIINSLEDAQFWAKQGVSFITLIHLTDGEFGSAAIHPSLITRLINFRGYLRLKKNRGLKEKGKQAITWLAKAGIMTDITHMESRTRKQAIAYMEQNNIPILSTHEAFKPLQNRERALDKEDVLNIYKNNGLVSLPNSGEGLKLYKPYPEINKRIDTITCYKDGSIDSYKWTYYFLKEYIESDAFVKAVKKDSSINFNTLSEADKINFAIGFQSDFNGWLNHSKPRFSKKELSQMTFTDKNIQQCEMKGLAHPGLTEAYWKILENEGVDLSPIPRASEKFLQLWEYMLINKTSFK